MFRFWIARLFAVPGYPFIKFYTIKNNASTIGRVMGQNV